MESRNSGSLCVSCGLCCDGTLFSSFDIEPNDETAVLRASGIEILTSESGKMFAAQPCAAFKSGCCSVYADRPAGCRVYRCTLLKKYEAGQIAFEEAGEIVESAKRLRGKVLESVTMTKTLPSSVSIGEAGMIAGIREMGNSPEGRRQNAQLLVDWGGLLIFLEKHFKKKKPKPEFVNEPEFVKKEDTGLTISGS